MIFITGFVIILLAALLFGGGFVLMWGAAKRDKLILGTGLAMWGTMMAILMLCQVLLAI